MGSVLNCKLLRYFSTYVDDNEVMGCDLSQLTPEERETVPMATYYLNPSFFNIIPQLFKLILHVRFCLNM